MPDAPFPSIELQAAFALLPDPAILIGEDHRILAANRACCALIAAEEELVGRRCFEVFHGTECPCRGAGTCPVSCFRATGERRRFVHVHRTPRGEEHHEVSVYPFSHNGKLDGSGTPAGFLEVLRPVPISSPGPRPRRLVGRSDAFLRMLELVLRVAPQEHHVLLIGETGTGKKLVAEAIHRLSRRAKRPLVKVYCTGLDELRFENELFGRLKGALPEDTSKAPGKVAQAQGGTLLLDDVGDLGVRQQGEVMRLLRLHVRGRLEDLRPEIGLDSPAPSLRLVCTAHPSILHRVAKGLFSRDLYYRLSAFPIELPPLRERTGDLPVLVEQLLAELAPKRRLRIDAEALAVLERYPFPGNIRELRSVVEHACLAADADLIRPRHLPDEVHRPPMPGIRRSFLGPDRSGRS